MTIFEFEQTPFCQAVQCIEVDSFVESSAKMIQHRYRTDLDSQRYQLLVYTVNGLVTQALIKFPKDNARSPEARNAVRLLLKSLSPAVETAEVAQRLLDTIASAAEEMATPLVSVGAFQIYAEVTRIPTGFTGYVKLLMRDYRSIDESMAGMPEAKIASSSSVFLSCACSTHRAYDRQVSPSIPQRGIFSIKGTVEARVQNGTQQLGMLIDLRASEITPIQEWQDWASIPKQSLIDGTSFFFPLGQLKHGAFESVATVEAGSSEKILSAFASHKPIVLIVVAPNCPSPPKSTNPAFTPVCYIR